MLSKYQKFVSTVIKRSEIKNAPYNPRVITDKELKKLKKNIKTVGLLATIVVNKNTMNIVSGHQRLTALDSLERKQDYELTVAMVDLTDKQEKEQNLFMNNEFAQGSWDFDKLKEMIPDINIEDAGFEVSELALMDITFDSVKDETPVDLEEQEKRIQDMKKKKKESRANSTAADDSNYFLSVIFPSVQAKEDFLYNLGVDKFEQYFKSDKFFDLIGYHAEE